MLGGGRENMQNPLYVEKELLPVYIVLTNGIVIKGNVHIAHRVRLTDTLNYGFHEKPFLPMTDSIITFPNGDKRKAPFLLISRLAIAMCIPLEQQDAPS